MNEKEIRVTLSKEQSFSASIARATGEPIKIYGDIKPLEVTESGIYKRPRDIDGYNPVIVRVPQPELEDLTATENGTYKSDMFGYNQVTVDVPQDVLGYTVDDIANRELGSNISSNTVTKIGDFAFGGSDQLNTVNFPNATEVGASSFRSNLNLSKAYLPKATSLGSYCFAYCTNLQEVDFSSVGTVGTYCFYGCILLPIADMPEATDFGNYAFYNCYNLANVNAPNVTNLGNYVFRYCGRLQDAILTNVTTLGDYAFADCGLKSVDFPEAESLGTYCFANCSQLQTVNLPKATNFGNYCFSNCSQLKSAVLPSATTLGNYVFDYATNLEKVDLKLYRGSTNTTSSATLNRSFQSVKNLKYIAFQDLKNGFRQTGTTYSPFNTNSLTNVTNCYMIFDMTTPPTLSSLNGAFYNTTIRNKIVVCVPQSALSVWQSATNWASMNIQSIESLQSELQGQFDWLDQKYWSTT